jgi:hypothetical protein
MNKDLVRLLKFIGNCGCPVVPADRADHFQVQRSGVGAMTVVAALVAAAEARGLCIRREGKLFATRESRSFLRRALAAREEAFLDQHRTVAKTNVDIDGARAEVTTNLTESPLGQLSRLKDRSGAAWFSREAIAAGEQLARDFHFAALQPKVTMNYAPQLASRGGHAAGGGVDLADNVLMARKRVARAVAALGPELSGVALDVCCFEKGMEMVERERQWPARSAKLMLKTALLQLHRHYHPPAARAQRRSHAWGADGFRPDLA